MRLSLVPEPRQEALSEVSEFAAELQREVEVCGNDERRASLLYEIARLEERAGDDHAAARDWLAAVNTVPQFREPLEELLCLMQRRRSFTNFRKLTERIGRVSHSKEESIRFQLLRGDHLTDHAGDAEAARACYEAALNLDARNTFGWLCLQYVAAKTHDLRSEERALSVRVELAENASYRNALRLILADVQQQRERLTPAIETLELVSAADPDLQEAALLRLERLARDTDNPALLLRTLEQRFTLVARQLVHSEPSVEASQQVRSASVAVDAALRAALLHQSVSGPLRRADWLKLALGAMQDAKGQAAKQAADILQASYSLISALHLNATDAIKRVESGDIPVALHSYFQLHAAWNAASNAKVELAQDILQQAARQDPHSLGCRALTFHLSQVNKDWRALARSYLESAELLADPGDRVLFCLLGSASATAAGEDELSRAALQQAESFGASPALLARFGRSLATATHQNNWYLESTERLARHGEAVEASSARLELVRWAWLNPSTGALPRSLAALDKQPSADWLAAVLTAYAPNAEATANTQAALLKLARLYTGELSSAWMQLAAYRDVADGGSTDAVRWLTQLHNDQPSNTLLSAQLATVLGRQQRLEEAAQVLSRCASQLTDPERAALLWLESGILRWRANQRLDAVEHFRQASALGSRLGTAFAYFGMSATKPDAGGARRQVIEQERSLVGDTSSAALQLFALEAGSAGRYDDAVAALNSRTQGADRGVSDALRLARALIPAATDHSIAIRQVGERTVVELELARATAFYAAAQSAQVQSLLLEGSAPATPTEEGADAATLLSDRALEWAELGSLPAVLELLGTALRSANLPLFEASLRSLFPQLEENARDPLLGQLTLLGAALPPAPEGSGAQKQLADLECAPPGALNTARASALMAAAAWLGSEDNGVALGLAAANQLDAGETDAALSALRELSVQHPDELWVWEQLCTAAELAGDTEQEAEACLEVGQLCSDAVLAAEYFRRASRLYTRPLNNPALSRVALQKAVSLDASDFESVDVWLQQLESHAEYQDLLELLDRRETFITDEAERTSHLWRRAKAYHGLGLPAQALSDALAVKQLAPEHSGASALAAEIHLDQNDYVSAVAELERLSLLENAPQHQRVESALAAGDVYLTQLGDLDAALGLLARLGEANLDTALLGERVARQAVARGRWQTAADLFASLMRNRSSAEGRVEAARLALAVHRDHLNPRDAEAQVAYLLQHAPGDADAVDLTLSEVFDASTRRSFAEQARSALCETLSNTAASGPSFVEGLARLARVGEFLEDLTLRQASLGSLVALGTTSADVLSELDELQFHARVKLGEALSAEALALLSPPGVAGPLNDVLSVIAPELSQLVGPSLKALGLGRGQRHNSQEAPELHRAVSDLATSFGVHAFELYVGGKLGPLQIATIGETEPVSIVLGNAIYAPFDANLRGRLAAHIFGHATGRSMLMTHEVEDVAAFLIGLFRACDLPAVDAENEDSQEYEQLLRKKLSRKTRKLLTVPLDAAVAARQSEFAWADLALQSLDRAALLAAGDPSWVLRPGQRDISGETIEGVSLERTRGLVQFAVSPAYLTLRRELSPNNTAPLKEEP